MNGRIDYGFSSFPRSQYLWSLERLLHSKTGLVNEGSIVEGVSSSNPTEIERPCAPDLNRRINFIWDDKSTHNLSSKFKIIMFVFHKSMCVKGRLSRKL